MAAPRQFTSPALAGEVGERSETGEGDARGTTLTLGAMRRALSREGRETGMVSVQA